VTTAATRLSLLALVTTVAACQFSIGSALDAAAPVDDLGIDLGADLMRMVPDGAVPRGLGYPCSGASECDSAACVDAYCCESLCAPGDPASLCKACNVPGHEGRCFDAQAGTDPHQQCEPDPVAPCGKDGLCDGNGACRRRASGTDGGCEELPLGQPCTLPSDCASGFCSPQKVCCDAACAGNCQACNLGGQPPGHCAPLANGTQCAPPVCAGDSTLSARSCDGAGSCQPATATDCTPYTCDKANATCFTKPCAGNQECASGHTCNSGSTKCM
jgi:hypothetical protein